MQQHHFTTFPRETPPHPRTLCAGEVLAVASPLPSPIALTGQCPHCGRALVTRISRDQTRFIRCSGFPACPYRADYDPILHQLRDRLARAEAEAALLRLQTRPVPSSDLVQCSMVESGLQQLGNLVLRKRHEAPALAAELTTAIIALRQRVRGGVA
jgi:Topoisomerase DNA binding C4 zinc finger